MTNKLEQILLTKYSNDHDLPESSVNLLISSLAWMLEEGTKHIRRIKQKILNDEIGKFPGNSSLVILEKEKAYIQPLYGEDADEYRLEMKKDNLLEVLNEWEDLMKKQPQEIILMINEKGVVTIKQQK